MLPEHYTPYKWSIAYHEAGHVLGARLIKMPIESATIIPSFSFDGRVLGLGFTGYEDSVIFSLMGHAADLEFGYCSSGFKFSSDYNQAVTACKKPIRNRKSDEWAIAHGYTEGVDNLPVFLWGRFDFRTSSDYRSWLRAKRVSKKEWKPEFDRLSRKARRLAHKHRDYILSVATLLMQHNTLTDDMIPQLGGN